MGGKLFSVPSAKGEPALYVPRLSPLQFETMRSMVLEAVESECYVRPARTAPEKTDHGDIDLIVMPRSLDPELLDRPGKLSLAMTAHRTFQTTNIIMRNLGVVRSHFNSNVFSLAVPAPATVAPADLEPHVQVDLILTKSRQELDWHEFLNSYGDLRALLCMICRSLGLVINHEGFHVIVPEIDGVSYYKEKKLLFLTSHPCECLEFLGLDWHRYDLGFDTLKSLFEWILTCRFVTKAHPDPNALSSRSDRKHLESRPMFQQFVRHWLPPHQEKLEPRPQLSRSHVLFEALDQFNQTGAYTQRLDDFNKFTAERHFWLEEVPPCIPKLVGGEKHRKRRMKNIIEGLKHFTICQDGRPVLGERSLREEDANPGWLEKFADTEARKQALFEFIRENWAVAERWELNLLKAYESAIHLDRDGNLWSTEQDRLRREEQSQEEGQQEGQGEGQEKGQEE
jgi:hypothetical protein